MPGLRGDDRVEHAVGRVPVLELRDLRGGPAPPGGGHPRIGVHAEHPAAGRPEQAAGYAGAASDVENVAPRAGGDDAAYQVSGIVGPGPVIAVGVGAEPLGDPPLEMRLLCLVVASAAGHRHSPRS